MRPFGLNQDVTYTLKSEQLFLGTERIIEQDNRPRHDIGLKSGEICTMLLYNSNYVGHYYRISVSFDCEIPKTSTYNFEV